MLIWDLLCFGISWDVKCSVSHEDFFGKKEGEHYTADISKNKKV